MPDNSTDEYFLRQALDLARQSLGLVSPNPCVGAVVVDRSGVVAGTGSHTYGGVKHAEMIALEAAGIGASGGTLYINLEPCSHHGRTPPCAEAIIAAGMRRVVASMADPNPAVSGRGFERLRSAGIAVEIGGLQGEARRLNESFAGYIRDRIPFVTLKSAMTLDGKIALVRDGTSRDPRGMNPRGWITGEAARAHVQELRHQNDALLAGIGTILADDPMLTDRSGHPRRRPLLRVILDSQLRLPLQSRLVQSAAAGGRSDALIFCSTQNPGKQADLESLGVRVERLAGSVFCDNNPRPNLNAVLRRLGELEITSLMIEGGSTVNGAALAGGVVDKVFFFYAPKIFGSEGIPFAKGSHRPEEIAVNSVQLHRFGDEDFAVEGYLRDPYADRFIPTAGI